MPVLAYMLTFGTYAARLHGDERGSWHHRLGFVPANAQLHAEQERRVVGGAVTLDERERRVVLEELRRTCSYRGWRIIAAHVRAQHVHLVVAAADVPESVLLRELKAWTSRRLHEHDAHLAAPRVWARGGNAVRLWTDTEVEAAKRYVLDQQGTPMAWFAE